MNTEQLVDQLFQDLNDLIIRYAQLGPRDMAYILLSKSYELTMEFGPRNLDLEDHFVGMAMECTEKMKIHDQTTN